MKRTRVFWKDNAALNDITMPLRRITDGSQVLPFVAAEDKILIGNIAPFNHFYAHFITPNTASSTMSIDYWDGNDWVSAVEVIDQTDGFTKNEWVEFVPDKDSGWIGEDTDDSGANHELNSLKIYNLYWIRISFSNDLDAGTELSYIGPKFSDDNDLGSEYRDLVRSAVLDRFLSGKTTWDEQHVQAAQYIIQDLIKKNIIWSKGQVLSRDQFMLASIHKTAEIIYSAFGDDYKDQRTLSENKYQATLSLGQYPVDANNDGRLSYSEQRIKQGIMSR